MTFLLLTILGGPSSKVLPLFSTEQRSSQRSERRRCPWTVFFEDIELQYRTGSEKRKEMNKKFLGTPSSSGDWVMGPGAEDAPFQGWTTCHQGS